MTTKTDALIVNGKRKQLIKVKPDGRLILDIERCQLTGVEPHTIDQLRLAIADRMAANGG